MGRFKLSNSRPSLVFQLQFTSWNRKLISHSLRYVGIHGLIFVQRFFFLLYCRSRPFFFFNLTYGCECWTITSDIEKKIEAAEMWFIRRMLRISWTEKKTNVNVLREGNVQRSLLKTIRKRQMEFLGHVCRRRGLEFLSLTGKVEGKRDRGKQRITFLDSLCNSATGGQSKGLNFLKLSDDRDVWRGMVANVCSRSGT